MSDKLLPCPFCGGEAEYYGECDMVWVRCSRYGCYAEMISRFDEPEEAAAVWNRRTIPPPTPLTVEQLKAMKAEPLKHWVWIEILDTSAFTFKAFSAYYRTYADYTDGKEFCCGWPGVGYSWDYCDYGKTWIAYDRKPEGETL